MRSGLGQDGQRTAARLTITVAAPGTVFHSLHSGITELVNSLRGHEAELEVCTDQDALRDYDELIESAPGPADGDGDRFEDDPVVLGQVQVSTGVPGVAFSDLCAAIRVYMRVPMFSRWQWTVERDGDVTATPPFSPSALDLQVHGISQWRAMDRGLARDPLEVLAHHDPSDITWWVVRWTRPEAPGPQPLHGIYRSDIGAHLSDVLEAVDSWPEDDRLPADLAVELTPEKGGQRILLTLIQSASGELTFTWPQDGGEPVVERHRRTPCGYARSMRPDLDQVLAAGA